MYVVLGASGQVGSALVKELLKAKKKVKAVIHHAEHKADIEKKGASVAIADGYELESLKDAFKGGDVLFVITPETGKNENLIQETKVLLSNYRKALESTTIKKIVGLSSLGAQLGKGSGNLEMSYLLENAFDGLPVTQVFIRPAYYFSNWLMGIDKIKETGNLPSFFPASLSLPMVSPLDVAQIASEILAKRDKGKVIYEIMGPESYTPADVAAALTLFLDRPVTVGEIPKKEWEVTLTQMGFTSDGRKQFIKMTELVIAGKTLPENKGGKRLAGKTRLGQYIMQQIKEV